MAEAKPWADFHLHSNCSDGSDAPGVLAQRVAEAGARAFSLTDHDTTAGNAEAAAAAAQLGLVFVPGVEISSTFGGAEVHIIALGIRVGHAGLEEKLAWLREARARRSDAILARLAELGHDLRDDAALAAPEGGSTGRMHIAAALAARGVVRRPQDAFDRFLNPGRAAYVPREKIASAEAIALVHDAGGLAFVAHPGLNKGVRKLLPELLALPFDGVEAWHISHTPGRQDEFVQLARARGLLVSGGSDCHGHIKGRCELGRVRFPWLHAEAILARL